MPHAPLGFTIKFLVHVRGSGCSDPVFCGLGRVHLKLDRFRRTTCVCAVGS
jgi:hypothetical protein